MERLEAWKSKDSEGYIWCESVVCFPFGTDIEKIFTKENLIQLYQIDTDELDGLIFDITFDRIEPGMKIYAVNIWIYWETNGDYVHTTFLETAGALILDKNDLQGEK